MDLLTTKQSFKNSKYTLGLNLGISLQDVNLITKPLDSFPIPSDEILNKLNNKETFYSLGLKNRMDLKTYELNIRKSELNMKIVKDQLQPDLDLKFSTDYTDVKSNRNENSSTLSLSYTFPIENSAARGQVIAYKSQLAQDKIKYKEFKRKINLDIDKTIENIKITIQSNKQIEKSIKNYEEAVENEQLKYSLGLSTMLNVIQTNDSLYDEQIRKLDILKTYATQIAQLYFDIGILSNDNKTEFSIDYKDFFTINEDKTW